MESMTGRFAVHRIANWVAAACPQVSQPFWDRFRASPLWMRLAKGLFWSVVGAVVSRAIGVLGSIVVARLLGITPFGEFTMIQGTVGLFGTFAGLGLGITATKYVAEYREDQKERCGRVIVLTLAIAIAGGALGSIVLASGSSWLATRTLAAPHLASALQASAALVFFSTLQSAYTGALAGFEAFKRTALVNLAGGVIGTPAIILGAWCWGVNGAVWGITFQALVACVVAHLALVKEARQERIPMPFRCVFRPSIALGSEFEVLWKFCLPAFLSSTLVGPVNWACNTLLVNQPHGYPQAALLSAANQWKNCVGFLPLMLSSVIVPVLANLHAKGQTRDFMRVLRRQVAIHVASCSVLILPLIALARPIMRSYGPGFVDGVPVFILTLFSTVLIAINNPLSKSMQSAGKAWLDLAFSGLWAVVLLSSCALLVPRDLALGIAIAQFLAAAVLAGWQWWFVRRTLAESSELPRSRVSAPS
jgi:O-antigen/teichoic acid export membrane protein